MGCPGVCNGATLQCSFGLAPSPLCVVPISRTLVNSVPMANIMDNKSFVNILPFGMCSSMANPTVAAATAAAARGADADALHSRDHSSLDARFADNTGGRHARPDRAVEADVQLGRRDSDCVSGTGDDHRDVILLFTWRDNPG
ncbi:DUF4280 domain-containing protein [Citrobacter sedlakii]